MILGVDPGRRRVGLALADRETRIAMPLETIDRRTTDAVERIAQIVRDRDVDAIVVGKPLSLTGEEGPAVEEHRAFVAALSELGVEVSEHDERLTTVIAERGLQAAGVKRKDREGKRDAAAAQVLLQSYLDGAPWR